MTQKIDLRDDTYINELATIFIANCGISATYRTIAFNLAIEYIERKHHCEYYDALRSFEAIMDEIEPSHREYDILGSVGKEEDIKETEEYKQFMHLYYDDVE